MSERNIIYARRNMEELVPLIKKDMMWLLISTGVAVGAAIALAMLIL